MEFINFRSENNTLIMTLNEEADFKILIDSIHDRLKVLKEKPSMHPPYVSLVLGKRKLKPGELLELIDVFMKEDIMLIDSIIAANLEEQRIEVIESSIRAGQILKFDNSVMVIGDVHSGATIMARNNIYIVGKLMGNAVVKSKRGKIVSAIYQNAIVRIYDSCPSIITSSNGELLTYENGEVKKNLVEEYKVKRSEINGTDNYGYVR
jgi:septum site-determining protein MinC